jgi:hypothetical protein
VEDVPHISDQKRGENKMSATQQQLIEEHLRKRKKGITSWDAITTYGITRLAKYIHDLRSTGFRIDDKYEFEGRRKWKRYWLVSAPKTISRKVKK